MKYIKYLGFAIFLGLLAACSPMDDKYSQFIEDGPITYIAKVEADSVIVSGGRNRIQLSWPKSSDPRGKTATIYWSNKMEKKEIDVNPDGRTSVIIDNLAEGTYIFQIVIFDNEGNYSIPITKTGEVFGENYERYLINRAITNIASGADKTITFAKVVDTTMVKTEIEWMQDGKLSSATIDVTESALILPGIKAISFKYRTTFRPAKGIDEFHSPYAYYLENVKPADVTYAAKKFTFVKPNDGFWTGFEIAWIDKTTGEAKSHVITGNEAVVNDYNGREVSYRAMFNIDGTTLYSSAEVALTVSYVDLDRTNWYAAPETDLSGSPIANVNYGSAPPAASATSGPTITNKLQSPYLSHLLPFANAALSTSNGDGANSPSAHFDGNSMTYLSMVKGIGSDATSGAGHVNGGVNFTGVDEKPWFIIRLDENTPQTFNYFRIRYRENGSNGSGLKPQGVTLFGSNDDSCINDETKWTQINPSHIVPTGSTAGSTQPPAADMGKFAPGNNLESDNMLLPVTGQYKYVKVRYDRWEVASNTIQIAEFYLGFVE